MEKSAVEQEREIKDLIRRAKGNPDRIGSLRRDTFNRLIDLTHSPYPDLKILAAQNLRFFLPDFPQFEEAAIDAIYDLCEDQSSRVRMEGYSAITQASEVNNKWVKRNADVLLQLLQSDEPDEVVVVKKALAEHLDLEPKVTLSVLCDQLSPPEENLDEEEQAIRVRLRSLVLLFLTGEAKRAIVEKHALPGSGAEEILLNSLLLAIPKLGLNDVEIIVRDLLLSLPTFKSGSAHGCTLTNILLDKVSSYLRAGVRSGDVTMLNSAQSCLDLVAFVAVTKRAAPAIQSLRFYCSSISTKMTLQRFSKQQQSLLACNIAETLDVASQGAQPVDGDGVPLDAVRRQVVDSCPLLFESLAINSVSGPRVVNACAVLLRACLMRKEQTQWSPPPNLISALSRIDSTIKGGDLPNVQNLIRLLLPPSSNSAPLRSKGKTPERTSSTRSPKKIEQSSLLLPTRPSTNGFPPLRRMSIPLSEPQVQRQKSFPGSATTIRDSASTSKHQITPEPSLRPPKRLKESADDEPALLKRLGTSLSSQRDSRMVTSRSSTAHSQVSDVSQPSPNIGYSIKGAAAKGDRSIASPSQRNAIQPPSSLLNRLEGEVSGISAGMGTKNRGRP